LEVTAGSVGEDGNCKEIDRDEMRREEKKQFSRFVSGNRRGEED